MEQSKSVFQSKTMGFAGALIGLGLADQFTNIIPLLVPDGYRGIALAVVGVVVAVLRKLTDTPVA